MLCSCSHLVEHEDNEMMVPFCFGQPGYTDPHNPAALMCPGRVPRLTLHFYLYLLACTALLASHDAVMVHPLCMLS
jgi:hypothetical protein